MCARCAHPLALPVCGVAKYAILGIEEQTHIDYSMPARVWLYDAMTLDREVRARENHNRMHRKKEANRHFTSRLLPCDRVNAVITLVVYLSDTRWDGPRRISDLVNPVPEGLAPYFNDYRLNLLCPNDLTIEEIHRFKSDLAAVPLSCPPFWSARCANMATPGQLPAPPASLQPSLQIKDVMFACKSVFRYYFIRKIMFPDTFLCREDHLNA